ncbi:MAG: hypothetical protein NUW23_15660 [Firmicutes bacterium]|jgi:hypothetical protein|nr:hypothetical protein [Bacillota bacterium]
MYRPGFLGIDVGIWWLLIWSFVMLGVNLYVAWRMKDEEGEGVRS